MKIPVWKRAGRFKNSHLGTPHIQILSVPIWGLTFISSVASKRAAIERLAKKLSREKLPCLFVIHTSAFLRGTRRQCILHEADWTKTGGSYGKARLKEVLHASPCINNGQHMCVCSYIVMWSTWLWENHGLLTTNPLGCIVKHYNLRITQTSLQLHFYWIQGIFSSLLQYDFRK